MPDYSTIMYQIKYPVPCIVLAITLLWFSASPLCAQTIPACAVVADAGNSYDDCTGSGASRVCERLVCNGSAFEPMELWANSGAKGIDFGNDSSVCNSNRLGRLRYQGGTAWQYCNGTAWQNW
jgi:hypothetical protein